MLKPCKTLTVFSLSHPWLGLGAEIPTVSVHEVPDPVFAEGKIIRGTVGRFMKKDAEVLHSAALQQAEFLGPQWWRERKALESIQDDTASCMKNWTPKEYVELHEISILSVNSGNWLRTGQTPASGLRHSTYIST